TDPHRAITAITGKCRRGPLLERVGMYDAVKRPHLIATAAGDAENVGDEIFHGTRRTDAIERAHNKESITHPTKPIIPVTSRPPPGSWGIELVGAATFAPFSSKLHSLSVIPARMISSCQSMEKASRLTHSSQ